MQAYDAAVLLALRRRQQRRRRDDSHQSMHRRGVRDLAGDRRHVICCTSNNTRSLGLVDTRGLCGGTDRACGCHVAVLSTRRRRRDHGVRVLVTTHAGSACAVHGPRAKRHQCERWETCGCGCGWGTMQETSHAAHPRLFVSPSCVVCVEFQTAAGHHPDLSHVTWRILPHHTRPRTPARAATRELV